MDLPLNELHSLETPLGRGTDEGLGPDGGRRRFSPDATVGKAILLIAIANVADFLSSIETIAKTTVTVLSMGAVPLLIMGTLLVFVVGYVLLFRGLYRHFALRFVGRARIVVAASLFALVVVGFLLNTRYLAAGPNSEALLAQQIEEWASTLLGLQEESGGIKTHPTSPSEPQAWTTAQALAAILTSPVKLTAEAARGIREAFAYIESKRLRDGGWGYWEESSWDVTEITGWVVVANVASLNRRDIWAPQQARTVAHHVDHDLARLAARQMRSGGWGPVRLASEEGTRTYSTVMALWGFVEANRNPMLETRVNRRYRGNVRDGLHWILRNHHRDLGWVPNPERAPQIEAFPGLTAQTLYVLSRAEPIHADLVGKPILLEAKLRFLHDTALPSRSIGLSERLGSVDQHLRPGVARGNGASCQCDFLIEGSTFVWYPWTFATMNVLATDRSLTKEQQAEAKGIRKALAGRAPELVAHLESGGVETYESAEAVLAIRPNLAPP